MRDTFCVLPWMHLASHPHGGVTLCCVSDHTKGANRARNLGDDGKTQWLNLRDHTISEIMNSDFFRATRKSMLNGEVPPACARCFREEANGVTSKRITENSAFPMTMQEASDQTAEDGSITPKLRFVELRLGNICNVKCRSCNPASSSKWIAEYKKLEGELPFLRPYHGLTGFDWPEQERFWDDLFEHQDTLELVYINGGEPTLIAQHWAFLDRLCQTGRASEITLWYNINMTNLPERAFEIWRAFKRVRISCSIDDLGERNRLLRYGTNWETVLSVLDRLQSQDWLELSVNQTISWLNLPYLGEFWQFMAQRNISVYHNHIYDPAFLSPWILPEWIKTRFIDDLCGVIPETNLAALRAQILSQPSDSHLLAQGLAYNARLDQSRGEDTRSTFSAVYELLSQSNEFDYGPT